MVHHSPVEIQNQGGRRNWVLYASSSQPVRLVVFVHGFGGKTVGAWNRFADSGSVSQWWRESDMLFVGYDSLYEHPSETARWLRSRLPDFYPVLPPELLLKPDVKIREPSEKPYDELLLVGHSLGGFVLRLALCEQARSWLNDERDTNPNVRRPRMLESKLRLFSPASAGFHPVGAVGMLKASCLWGAVNVAMSRSPAYKALEKGSDLITNTRAETEELVAGNRSELQSLRAHLVWARPEKVVDPQGYKSDYVPESLIPKREHTEVCKPSDGYDEPLRFVQTGRHR